MKKQKLQLLLLAGLLIAAVIGYLWAKQMPKEEETMVTSKRHTVTNVSKDEVVEMTYLYEGKIIELLREDDQWKSKEKESLSLDQTAIDTMLDYVCNITSETMIADAESLEEYGLTNPSNTICLTLQDQSVVQVLIGDAFELTGENYILLAGDPKVYTISSYIANAFQCSLESLESKEAEE